MPPRHMLPNLLVMSILCIGLMGADRAGCTDAAPCSFDSDCNADQACVEDRCRVLCQSDADCTVDDPSLTCIPYTREGAQSSQAEGINVCSESEDSENNADNNANNNNSGNNDSERCVRDTDCSERFGSTAYCAATQTCVVPRTQTSILIQPTGTDPITVLAIMLNDSQGNPLGYGLSQSYMSDADPFMPLAGRAPSLNEDETCTTQGPELVLSGEEAYVHVRFVSPDGGPLTVDSSWRVRVITDHTNCDADAVGSNEYKVMQCVSTSEAMFERDAQCTQSLGMTTQGVAEFDLKSSLN